MVRAFIGARPLSFAIAVFGAMLFALAIVAAAVVIGIVTDETIIPILEEGASTRGRLLGAALAIVGVASWKAFGIVLRRGGAGWIQPRILADIRKRLLQHLLQLRLSWYQENTTGGLLAVAESDSNQATFILGPLPYATGSSFLLLATVAIVTYLDWPLGLLALASIAAVVAIDMRGAFVMFEKFQEVQAQRAEVSRVAHESFDGALTVKALGREDYEANRFRRSSEALRDTYVEVGRLWAFYRAIVESLPMLTSVAVLVVGALRIRSGDVSAGNLITIMYLFSLLTIPVRLMGWVTWDLAHSHAAWQRVAAVLEANDVVEHGNLLPVAGGGAEVDSEAVAFGYTADELVLTNVDLEIPAGRTIAIVGPTASGKSTLALLMARLWDPIDGSIRLDGRDLRQFAPSALPGEVAYVSQDTFLFGATVESNITMGRPEPAAAVADAARLAGAARFIETLPDGYDSVIGERGTTLSGGERQRIALARALIRRPRLLILDDATSAVDPSVEAQILRGLREAELPSTVVVVAYRPSSITIADEVVYLEAGRVVAHGTHHELLSSTPGYARLLTAYAADAAARAEATP
jgi:ABC-type multidrug transport system fused ATPase/permease subunit